MTFDAGALAAFALSVLTGFAWLIWQTSASYSEQKAHRQETALLRESFLAHEAEDGENIQRVHERIDGMSERVNAHDRELARIQGAHDERIPKRHSGGHAHIQEGDLYGHA